MSENPWVALFADAARQHGVVARWQALQYGIDGRTFTRRVRLERWRQPHRGVYVVPGAVWGPVARLSAGLLAVGAHAAIGGLSALNLHGVVDRQPAPIDLVVPHSRRAPRLHGVRVRRTRTLARDDITVTQDLRCVTPARGFLDAAPDRSRADLRLMLIDARQRGVEALTVIGARALEAPPRLPGRSVLLAAVADVSLVGADSPLTDLVHRRLLADGFTPDPDPVTVDVGDRVLHPDVTFSAARICIEVDSLAYHRDQRSIDLDHRKDQAYATAWWRCLRIGWRRHDLVWPGFTAVLEVALAEWPSVWRGRNA